MLVLDGMFSNDGIERIKAYNDNRITKEEHLSILEHIKANYTPTEDK
jgi:hypothetical protein